MGDKLLKVFSFRIVDKADGTHSVEGIATSDAVDHDGERADYKGTLNAIKAWSAEFVKTTSASGQQLSLGNIRVQHDGKQIGGKVTAIEPDDGEKAIAIKTQPLDKVYEELIEPGMVTGFSIAGRYDKRWTDADGTWYIPEISEISYVDHPCNPDAGFTHVKASGATEFRKFAKPEARQASVQKALDAKPAEGVTIEQMRIEVKKTLRDTLIEAGLIKEQERKTLTVDGEQLPATCFAYVGDEEDSSTWKLAYKGFSTEAKNRAHVRKALARFHQAQGIPASEKTKVKAKLVAAAKKLDIVVSDKTAKAVRSAIVHVLCEHTNDEGKTWIERSAADKIVSNLDEIIAKISADTVLFKSMYTVGRLAELMDAFSWMVASSEYERDYEQDDSVVPDDLRSVLEDLIPVFVAMATEEANELLTSKKTANGGNGGKSMTDTTADLLKAAKEAALEFWKKAKSAFLKMGKSHDGCSKAFGKAAENHEALAEHHADCAEGCADKTVTDELAKLNAGADFKKADKVDQIILKADILIAKGSSSAKSLGKMAKGHAQVAKCMSKAAGHCDDLGKAAVDVGNADDAPDAQGRTKEEEDAKAAAAAAQLKKDQEDAAAAAALAKAGSPELVKLLQDGFKGVNDRIGEIEKSVAAVKEDVAKQGKVLEETPAEKTARLKLATKTEDNGGGDAKDGSSILDPKSARKASLGTAGMFAVSK